ncbi:hypothetical protein K1719_021807 [Acacia pycnantha]|nr:hypothetical protein K1719_021807 [Acacia pycnantha]
MIVQGDSPFLPDEIITNILKRLQVKTLIRFHCVSKLWKNLVRSPYFIADHVLHHTSNQCPRFLFNWGGYDPLNLFVVDYAATNKLVYLWKPSFMSKLSRTRFINSCNGLFCVRSDSNASSSDSELFFSDVNQRVEVYSLNTDTWREIEFGNTGIGRISHSHASFNGSIFWVAENGIVSFDLVREVFTFMPVPGLYIKSQYLKVLELNKKLVLVGYTVNGRYEYALHFWEMEEVVDVSDDKKWSWKKIDKSRTSISNLSTQVLVYVESLVPIANINREEPKS